MKDIILDTLLDGLKLLPFLLVAFLFIELVEHKLGKKSKGVITKTKNFGPLLGGIFGLFPQCGFSVMATNLYVTRIISLGTLIAIYLSTSDEMLPIMLSSNVPLGTIFKILGIKLFIGVFFGFIIDLFLPKNDKKLNYDICESDHCHCGHGVLLSSLKHTGNTLLFVVIISFIINVVSVYIGNQYLEKLFFTGSVFGPFVASLVGLIPNCGASIMISELYLEGVISFGAMIAGLLTGSGVALLVLFKSNKNKKENLRILALIYLIGVFCGIILDLFM